MQNDAGRAIETFEETLQMDDLRRLASAEEAELGMYFSRLIGKRPKKRKPVLDPETEMLQILQRMSR